MIRNSRLPAVLAALPGLLLGACSAPPQTPPAARSVLVQRVAESAGGMRAYTGEVRARIETPLGFRIGGKILARTVDVGSVVHKGQVLARLDPVDTLLQAHAAAAQAASAEADLKLAESEWQRAAGLRRQNFISASAMDARVGARDAAAARLRQARAQAELADQQQGYSQLLADRDGVVTATLAEPGQVVESGTPVLHIATDASREVLIHLPENGLQGIAVGTPAQVRPWSAPATVLAGRVREVAPAADAATRTFAVRVAVPGAGGELPLGATATAIFATGNAGLVLPLNAVTTVDGKPAVWVVGPDGVSVAPRTVQVLRYDERGAHLRDGLQPGEQVVVAGVAELRPGQKVHPVPATQPVALDAQR